MSTCLNFSPHCWRENICKNCFNKRQNHLSLTTTKVEIKSAPNENISSEDNESARAAANYFQQIEKDDIRQRTGFAWFSRPATVNSTPKQLRTIFREAEQRNAEFMMQSSNKVLKKSALPVSRKGGIQNSRQSENIGSNINSCYKASENGLQNAWESKNDDIDKIKIDKIIPRLNNKSISKIESISSSKKVSGIPRVSKKPVHDSEAIANHDVKPLQCVDDENATGADVDNADDQKCDSLRDKVEFTSFGVSKIPQKRNRSAIKYHLTTFQDSPKTPQLQAKAVSREGTCVKEIGNVSNNKQDVYAVKEGTKEEHSITGKRINNKIGLRKNRILENRMKNPPNRGSSEQREEDNRGNLDQVCVFKENVENVKEEMESEDDKQNETIRAFNEAKKTVTENRNQTSLIRGANVQKDIAMDSGLIVIGKKDVKQESKLSSFLESKVGRPEVNVSKLRFGGNHFLENSRRERKEATVLSQENLAGFKPGSDVMGDWKSVTGSLDRAMNRNRSDEIGKKQNVEKLALKSLSETRIPRGRDCTQLPNKEELATNRPKVESCTNVQQASQLSEIDCLQGSGHYYENNQLDLKDSIITPTSRISMNEKDVDMKIRASSKQGKPQLSKFEKPKSELKDVDKILDFADDFSYGFQDIESGYCSESRNDLAPSVVVEKSLMYRKELVCDVDITCPEVDSAEKSVCQNHEASEIKIKNKDQEATGITPITGINNITPVTGITPITGITPVTGSNRTSSITAITAITRINNVTPITGITPITAITGINNSTPVTGMTGITGITPITGSNSTSPITGVTAITRINNVTPITGITPITAITGINNSTPVTGMTGITGITPITGSNSTSPITGVNNTIPFTSITAITGINNITPITRITAITGINNMTPITAITPVTAITAYNNITPITGITPITPITANNNITATKEIPKSNFALKAKHGDVEISNPVTSSCYQTFNSDFITIKQKEDTNNNHLETNSLVKLGSFSTRNNSKFGGLCRDFSINDVNNKEEEAFSGADESTDKELMCLSKSRFDFVHYHKDKATESKSNPSTQAEGNTKIPFVSKNKNSKTLSNKSRKSKAKKKSKGSWSNDDLKWEKREVFYSNVEAMPDESLYSTKSDVLLLRKTNSDTTHYKSVPETSCLDLELKPCLNEDAGRGREMSGRDNESALVVGNGITSVSKPSAKVKPYTVVDLSTMSALTPEEVDNCLEEVTEAETIEWLKYGEPCLNDEAPENILPPKQFRKRSNTTGLILNKKTENSACEKSKQLVNQASTSPKSKSSNKAAINLEILNYSQPGVMGLLKTEKQELSSFRKRSKTVPAKSELQALAKNVTPNRSSSVSNSSEHHNPSDVNSCNGKDVSSLMSKNENIQGPEKDPCGSPSGANEDANADSKGFPPLPSFVELTTGENEMERCSTPDWPPLPTALSDVKTSEPANEASLVDEATHDDSEVNDNALEKPEKIGYATPSHKTSSAKDVVENAEVAGDVQILRTGKAEGSAMKQHDAHRSLPPIPGDANNSGISGGSMDPEVPLSWVTKSASLGPGPYIPMCHPGLDGDEIPTAHFYDDIDNIRKIAQERALMIKRLQEEEAERILATNGEVNRARVSLGEMPDVIPNVQELDVGIKDAGADRNDSIESTKKKKKKKSGKEKKAAKEASLLTKESDPENIAELSLVSGDKKNPSRFAKLIRKISAPAKKSGDYDFAQRKATTPQPVRKATFTKNTASNRSEIFATPSTTRRLFSLSLNRGHRQRTNSDTEIMKSILDKEEEVESKRIKQRTGTISFGFGRRKTRVPNLEHKAFSDDNRSVRSLEMMRIGHDFDSQSSCSTRITPATSPLLLTKFNSVRKYKAPDPPNWKQHVPDWSSSGRSECSGSEKSFPGRLPLNSSSENVNGETASEACYGNYPLTKAQMSKPVKPARESVDSCDKTPLQECSMAKTGETTGGIQDEVFAAGCYDNFPLSKQMLQKPSKPPRSESDNTDPSGCKSRVEKPRRASMEPGILTKPEPYSSQRIHRKIIDHKLDLSARFSPTLSNSEDEAGKCEPHDYQVPYDNITTDEHFSRKTVKTSASDNCLSSKVNLRRDHENISKSEELLDRCNAVVYSRPDTSLSEGNHREHIYDRVAGNSPNILRYSIDSYDKLLEIHRETVQQIATASVFKCDCSDLKDSNWNDFEICGKMMNFGIGSYVTVPVSLRSSQGGNKITCSAWLRQSLDFLQKSTQVEALDAPLSELSYHENLLHVCKDIERNREDDINVENGVPQDIHVKIMLLSKCTPKMSLSRYLSSTLDKHDKDPAAYEKEACLILLQIFKGLRHLLKRGYFIDDIDCDLVLLSDVNRGILSSGGLNNNQEPKSCPTAQCLALPGLLKRSVEVKGRATDVKGHSSRSQTKANINDAIHSVSLEDSAEHSSDVQECHEENGTIEKDFAFEGHQSIVVLIFELFHSSQHIEKESACSAENPKLPEKSIYSRRMQFIVNKLISDEPVTIEALVKYMELIAFCPPLAEKVDGEQTRLLIRKWRNRRCVDIVTDMLKKYSLIALASGLASGGKDKMGLSRECALECQFLANTTVEDINDVFAVL